jgi:Arc/MetJ family transcription regulator
MRTTIDIDDKLLALAKKRALEKGTSLRNVIEFALRRALMESKKAPSRFRLKWKTVRGNPIPGVDISDRDAIYERMEDRE